MKSKTFKKKKSREHSFYNHWSCRSVQYDTKNNENNI